MFLYWVYRVGPIYVRVAEWQCILGLMGKLCLALIFPTLFAGWEMTFPAHGEPCRKKLLSWTSSVVLVSVFLHVVEGVWLTRPGQERITTVPLCAWTYPLDQTVEGLKSSTRQSDAICKDKGCVNDEQKIFSCFRRIHHACFCWLVSLHIFYERINVWVMRFY